MFNFTTELPEQITWRMLTQFLCSVNFRLTSRLVTIGLLLEPSMLTAAPRRDPRLTKVKKSDLFFPCCLDSSSIHASQHTPIQLRTHVDLINLSLILEGLVHLLRCGHFFTGSYPRTAAVPSRVEVSLVDWDSLRPAVSA